MSLFKRKYHVNIPPKKVLSAYVSIPSRAHQGTDLREIQAASCDHIRTAEIDIVMLQSLGIVETTGWYNISNCKR